MTISLERFELPEPVPNPKCEFYLFCDNDRSPVADFLGKLENRDFDAFMVRLRTFAERGEIHDPSKYKAIQSHEGIYEFKIWGWRLFCFHHRRKCILVEGCRKQSDRATNKNQAAYKRASSCRDKFLLYYTEEE